jgi:hypothetical protein
VGNRTEALVNDGKVGYKIWWGRYEDSDEKMGEVDSEDRSVLTREWGMGIRGGTRDLRATDR